MTTPKSPHPPPEHNASGAAVDLAAVYYRLLEIARDLDTLEACAQPESSEASSEVENGTD